jgi:hypothetical protein
MCQTKGYAILLISIAMLCSCADVKTRIVPAISADEVSGMPNAAKDSAAGVKITVQAAGWPGDAEIEEILQPVRVILENRSGRPILITYENFAMLGPRGRSFAALPPFKISGSAEMPALEGGYSPVTEPTFTHRGFELSPMYSPLYPEVTLAPNLITGNPFYYEHYHQRLVEVDLPTPAMLRNALPEGALQDGGKLDGYLYFEKVPPEDVSKVTFRAELVDVADGEVIGTLAIPFRVEADGLEMAEAVE